MRVKFSPPGGKWAAALGLIACLLSGGPLTAAQSKTIRLRNETISTPPKGGVGLQSLAAEPPVSGLFLVQFNGPPQAAWLEQLQALRVHVLRYVPDDAFVAQFEAVSPNQVRPLSFIRWVGPYRPDHKIQPSLQGAGRSPVRVLLSPKASARDALLVRRSLNRSAATSVPRFGAILQGEATSAQRAALASSDAVLWIEPAPRMRLFDEISTKIVAGDDLEVGTAAVVHQLGFDGRGVTVAVADSGLHNGDAATMHPDLAGRVDAFFFYGSLSDAADEHSHGTHVTGIIAGNAAWQP